MRNGDLPVSEFPGTDFAALLAWRAERQPDRLIFTALPGGDGSGPSLTCGALDREARAIATCIRAHASPGDRALLIYGGGLEFASAFFGCLYAGIVAVPVYPPDPQRLNQTLHGLNAVVADAAPQLVLTSTAIRNMAVVVGDAAAELLNLPWIATDEAVHGPSAWAPRMSDPDDVALIQYTSGSTAVPKGVMVTHANLLANAAAICRAFEHTPRSVGVSWLPIFHDMGLMGHVLQPVFLGAHNVLLSPLAFLQRPYRWLRAISDYGATTSGAPNFAFEICARRVSPEERAGLDLSSWRVAYCGAEPISADTLERFAETFAPCGFRREALYPCYGMAEATLMISGGVACAPPIYVDIDPEALRRHRAVPTAGPDARRLVGCGRATDTQVLRIVDPETFVKCPSGQVGEIWVSGPSVARGYWRLPAESAGTFRARLADTGEGPFLRTGDLGFIRDGELFVTGRLKDLIVLRGRNYHPQDLERTVADSDPSLRPGSGVVFAAQSGDGDRIVVVQELRRDVAASNLEIVTGRVVAAITAGHGIRPNVVVLVPPGTIPKTSSGKLRRSACRELYLDDALDEVHRWPRSRRRALRAPAGAAA